METSKTTKKTKKTKKTATIDIKTAAQLLGTNAKSAAARLSSLGYTVTCSRCGGTGRFSFNQITGDRCFKCSGRKKMLAPITLAMVEEAKTRIAAGELDGYFAENKARNAIKTASEAAWATYMGSAIGKEYNMASRQREFSMESPIARAQQLLDSVIAWVSDATHDRKRTSLENMARIAFAHQALHAIIGAWTTRTR